MPDWPFIAGALWLGIGTSISPCPLATNIAAVAFLARRTGQGRRVVWAGLAYTAGRAVAYTAVAAAIAWGVLSAPALSEFVRTRLTGLIGPLLILVGMVIAGWLPLRLPGSSKFNELGSWLAQRGMAGEFLLGALFALSFCPASAAIFFGLLLPMTVKADAPVSLSLLYGLGTAVPVIVAVFLLARGIEFAGRLQALQKLGGQLQTATAMVIIAAGVWLTVSGLLP
jgi:cytochrome c biogenesis protein CcdA